MFKEMKWFNEPPKWSIEGNFLTVETGYNTDFWRETHYKFIRDNGHFLYQTVNGDFTAEVTLIGEYNTLYDQAGLMIRVDNNNWIKTGIEFTDGEVHVSAVFTRNYSDWSVIRMPSYNGQLTIRLTRHGSAIRIQYLDENNTWRLLRLGYLDVPSNCQVGVMCCSPEREGFVAKFKDFSINEPISESLHE